MERKGSVAKPKDMRISTSVDIKGQKLRIMIMCIASIAHSIHDWIPMIIERVN